MLLSCVATLAALISSVSCAPTEQKLLISFAPGKQQWMTESQLFRLMKNVPEGEHLHFVDNTEGYWNKLEDYGKTVATDELASPFPTRVAQSALVNSMKPNFNSTYILDFLKEFTSFNTRYYTSTTGVQSAQFIYDQIMIVKNAISRNDVKLTVSKFSHSFSQFSVVARLEPVVIKKTDIVILGGHQDSINTNNPSSGRAPGVDDDATGVINNLSVLKVLYSNLNFIPDRPIEFHFYAAEEAGLRGSQAIVQKYVQDKVQVYGMLQSDMTGFKESKSYGVFTDFVNPNLTEFLKINAAAYVSLPVVTSTCGYGYD
jgi:leucyl aminopeptidase